jgi:uncharacterized protein (TIGR02246 family)
MNRHHVLFALAVAGTALAVPSVRAQPAESPVVLTVWVPADARVQLNGTDTTSTGAERRYKSPPVAVGQSYIYTVRVVANGKTVTRDVKLTPGLESSIDLRTEFGDGERVASYPPNRLAAAGKASGNADEPNPTLGKGKRAQEFIAAYEKGDARAVAAFWTETADYVDQTGRTYKGRAAIQKMYEKFFAENKGMKLKIIPLSVRTVGSDAAIEEGITEITPADGGLPSAAHFTAFLLKKDGEWFLESVHDSVPQPPSNAEHFDDLEWLLGDWAGEEEKGESARASYAWAENRNFIVSHFATTLDGAPVVGGTQWICWDAVDKKIRSYSFYSGGGVGEGVWTNEGNTWKVEVNAKTSAGKKISGTHVITKLDADHATWQLTKVTVDGQSIPDPKPSKMKRVKAEKR